MKGVVKTAALSLAARWSDGGSGIPVLLYHGIDDSGSALSVPPRQFRLHAERLAASDWTVLGAGELVGRRARGESLPERSVVLTFDDALVSQYTEAFPVLRDLGLAATVFVPTARVGTSAVWNREDGFPEFPLMGWDEVGEMAEAGIEMQSHARLHRSLLGLGEAELEDEVAGSMDDLRRRTGRENVVFSYPFGYEDEHVRGAVRAAGAAGAVAVLDRIYEGHEDLFRIPRVCMDNVRAPGDTAALHLLDAALNGTLPALTRVKRRLRSLFR